MSNKRVCNVWFRSRVWCIIRVWFRIMVWERVMAKVSVTVLVEVTVMEWEKDGIKDKVKVGVIAKVRINKIPEGCRSP